MEQPLNLLDMSLNCNDTQSSRFRNGISLVDSVAQLKMPCRHGFQLSYARFFQSHPYGSRRLPDVIPAHARTSPDATLTAPLHALHAHDVSSRRLRARARTPARAGVGRA